MSELSQKIQNLPCKPNVAGWQFMEGAYAIGHRDARHAAAELVLATDAELASVREACQSIVAQHDYRYLDSGIGTATAAGRAWLKLREFVDAARKGESDAE